MSDISTRSNVWTSKDVRRGEIFWIEDKKWNTASGSMQRNTRPAIIVSNDRANVHSPVVEVVFLTSQPKNDLPTHVTIRSAPTNSIALCEQITSINKDKIGDYIADCTDEEMRMVDQCLMISLALDYPTSASETAQEAPIEKARELDQDGYEQACLDEIAKLKAEIAWHESELKKTEQRERETKAKMVMMEEELNEARAEINKLTAKTDVLKEMHNELLTKFIIR